MYNFTYNPMLLTTVTYYVYLILNSFALRVFTFSRKFFQSKFSNFA